MKKQLVVMAMALLMAASLIIPIETANLPAQRQRSLAEQP